MTGVERIAAECGVTVEDLTVWVERRWILPGSSGAELFLTEADRARLRMIVEFRRDLEIDDEAMPVVLDLVDRLHALRAQLRSVLDAVAELPKPDQDAVLRRFQGEFGS